MYVFLNSQKSDSSVTRMNHSPEISVQQRSHVMCQPDLLAMGYQYIWLNIILGVSVRVVLYMINIHINRLSKVVCPPQRGCPHAVCQWTE